MKKVDLGAFKEAHQQAQVIRCGMPGQKGGKDASVLTLLTGTGHDSASFKEVLNDLGIDSRTATLQNLITSSVWRGSGLVDEVLLQPIMVGYSQKALWSSLIARDLTLPASESGNTISLPIINEMDGEPEWIAEGESFTFADLSFGKKSFKEGKFGKGLQMTYEARSTAKLDVLSIFLESFGERLGRGLTNLAIDCLINGEQQDGSEAAYVVGVATPGTITYRDLLHVWVRASAAGLSVSTQVTSLDFAEEILDLDEFKTPVQGTPKASFDIGITVPQRTSAMIHQNIPAGTTMIVDTSKALLKVSVGGLLIESEKQISKQTLLWTISGRTGFAKLATEAAIMIDSSINRTTNPFPESLLPVVPDNILL